MDFIKITSAFLTVLFLLGSNPTVNSLNGDFSKQAMSTLTSDNLQGRSTGSEGNKNAEDYLSDMFKYIGLEPVLGSSYKQEYEQGALVPEHQTSKFSAEFEDGTKKDYLLGEDFVAYISKEFSATLPLAFDLADAEITQKAILTEDYRAVSKAKQKPQCVLLNSPHFRNPSNIVYPVSITLPRVQVSNKVYNELKNNKVKNVTISLAYTPEAVKANNIVGKISGNSNRNAVVISAHFDHMGSVGSKIFRGAIDNASGTVVVLDLAQKLKERAEKAPFNMDIIFCAFNGEECGERGSTAFVPSINNKYENIYNINIDCVGMKNGGKIMMIGDSLLNDELTKEITKYFPSDQIIKDLDNTQGSDNDIFNIYRIPGITIIQENAMIPASIHNEKDTIDIVDFDTINVVVDSLYKFINANDGKAITSIIKPRKTIDLATRVPYEIPDKVLLNKIASASSEAVKTLAFDEYTVVEVDGYKNYVYGGDISNKLSIEDINKYTPYIKIPEKIATFKFDAASIIENKRDLLEKFDKAKEENGKTYKRDLSKENIYSVISRYDDGNNGIRIETSYTSNLYDTSFNTLGKMPLDLKDVEINGEKYYLIRQMGQENISGIGKNIIVDGAPFRVGIFRTIIKNDSDSLVDSTADELTDLVKQLNIEEYVKSLGI